MTQTITISSHGKSMAAQLSTPPGSITHGVIIIAYGSDGMSPPWEKMIEDYADSLVKKGFSTLIPNYLPVTNTQPGPAAFAAMMEYRNDWQSAISDAIDHAKNLPDIDPARVGLLGFSLGGHLCLRLRAKAKVLVEFFAPIGDGIGTSGPLFHAQIHHGKEDQLVPFANAGTIANTLKSEGTSTESCSYPGAGHGFIGDDSGNTKARDLSKENTLSFFESYL